MELEEDDTTRRVGVYWQSWVDEYHGCQSGVSTQAVRFLRSKRNRTDAWWTHATCPEVGQMPDV